MNTGQNLNFAVPMESVAGLAEAPPSKSFADGSQLQLPSVAVTKSAEPPTPNSPASSARPEAPDKSDLLTNSKDRDYILHHFRTMFVDAKSAQYFASDQLKAALGRNKDFAKLDIRILGFPLRTPPPEHDHRSALR
jgi:hypothetical protein